MFVNDRAQTPCTVLLFGVCVRRAGLAALLHGRGAQCQSIRACVQPQLKISGGVSCIYISEVFQTSSGNKIQKCAWYVWCLCMGVRAARKCVGKMRASS